MITTILISVPKVIFTKVGYRGYSLYKMASYIVQDFLIKGRKNLNISPFKFEYFPIFMELSFKRRSMQSKNGLDHPVL